MNELVEVKKNALLEVIERVATNKDVDVSKMQALIDMQIQVMEKEAEMAFNKAMANLQPLIPEIKKDAKGHNSKYAKYENIERIVRPLYTKEGFSIRYDSELIGSSELYRATLMHVAGHSVTATMMLPPDKSGSKNDLQAKGSTVSYARRYLLCMLLNIVTVDEDNDGENQLIDDSQFDVIMGLIEDSQTDIAKFCSHLKIDCIKNMPNKLYPKASQDLKMKIAKIGKG